MEVLGLTRLKTCRMTAVDGEAFPGLVSLASEISVASLRLLLDLTTIGIMITDLDHSTLAVNNAFGKIFQVDPDRVPSMGVEELRERVYPRLKDRESWLSQLDLVYSHPDTTYQDEIELVDDVISLIRRRTHPLRNQDGKIIGRVWTFSDITFEQMRLRQRQAMDAINEMRNPDPNECCRQIVTRVAEVFDSSCILSIRSGETLYFREKINVPSWIPDLKSNRIQDAYCQYALESLQPLLVQDADERPDLYLHLLPTQVGLKRYAGVPLCDSTGDAMGTLCILDDKTKVPLSPEDMTFLSVMGSRIVTELEREKLYLQRSADQKRQILRQEQELAETQQVLSAMNNAFDLLGKELNPRQIVAGQAQLLDGLLGYDSATLLYKRSNSGVGVRSIRGVAKSVRLKLAYHPEIATAFESTPAEWRHALLVTGQHQTLVRLPVEGKDPYILILGSQVEPSLTDERHTTHLLALVEQVALLLTAARLNEDLRKTHQDLRDTQTRLIQSEKLNVVGALAASVAHDIRNILASISIECSMPEQDPLQTLAKVQNQVDRFSVLSHRLLSYAKPRFLAREFTDLNRLIEQATGLLSTQARVTGVTTQVDLDPMIPSVTADSHRVEHLFVNLILNSLQAMHTQGGILTIKSSVQGKKILISISDNGKGMPPEIARRVFEPFYSTRKDGFGLGLYSCHKIVEEHGWLMTVESEEGTGTKFLIEIPLEANHP